MRFLSHRRLLPPVGKPVGRLEKARRHSLRLKKIAPAGRPLRRMEWQVCGEGRASAHTRRSYGHFPQTICFKIEPQVRLHGGFALWHKMENRRPQRSSLWRRSWRDANQSLIATRLPYSKFEGILPTMDRAGYYACECWGGATFDVCLRYLQEDPWERLRKIRAKMPNTKLQSCSRGQNVLGYSHYPDDFVRMFVRKSVENGIDIIRIFDALNDVNNMKVAIEETVKAGAIASGTISYTTSPVHTRPIMSRWSRS